MSEWSTYSLGDILLFSPRTYWRLIQLHNEAVWPLHLLALLVGAAILAGVVRPTSWTGRSITVGLAIAWMWVAWSFLWDRYATINWPIAYVAPVFALQGLVLIWFGVVRGRLHIQAGWSVSAAVGLALFVYALVLHPLAATIAGRSLQAAEVFGIAPDPTAIATLGLVSMARERSTWLLLILPLAWCALSWATLYAMGAAQAWIMLAAAVLAVAGGAASSVAGWALRSRNG